MSPMQYPYPPQMTATPAVEPTGGLTQAGVAPQMRQNPFSGNRVFSDRMQQMMQKMQKMQSRGGVPDYMRGQMPRANDPIRRLPMPGQSPGGPFNTLPMPNLRPFPSQPTNATQGPMVGIGSFMGQGPTGGGSYGDTPEDFGMGGTPSTPLGTLPPALQNMSFRPAPMPMLSEAAYNEYAKLQSGNDPFGKAPLPYFDVMNDPNSAASQQFLSHADRMLTNWSPGYTSQRPPTPNMPGASAPAAPSPLGQMTTPNYANTGAPNMAPRPAGQMPFGQAMQSAGISAAPSAAPAPVQGGLASVPPTGTQPAI